MIDHRFDRRDAHTDENWSYPEPAATEEREYEGMNSRERLCELARQLGRRTWLCAQRARRPLRPLRALALLRALARSAPAQR